MKNIIQSYPLRFIIFIMITLILFSVSLATKILSRWAYLYVIQIETSLSESSEFHLISWPPWDALCAFVMSLGLWPMTFSPTHFCCSHRILRMILVQLVLKLSRCFSWFQPFFLLGSFVSKHLLLLMSFSSSNSNCFSFVHLDH